MALEVGTNSYLDRDDADAYIIDRSDAGVWLTASDAEKDAALVTATRFLDDKAWIGQAVSVSQNLGWPRVNAKYYDNRLGLVVELGETDIPENLKRAVAETALYYLQNPGVYQSTATTYESISIGPISLSDSNSKKSNPKTPAGVMTLLRPLQRKSSVSGTWWRAN